jgi:hypothetical protein
MKKFLAIVVIIVISLTVFGSINATVLASWVKNGVKMFVVEHDYGTAYKANFVSGKSELLIVADVDTDFVVFKIGSKIEKESFADVLVFAFENSGLTGKLGENILRQILDLKNAKGFYHDGIFYAVISEIKYGELWISIH